MNVNQQIKLLLDNNIPVTSLVLGCVGQVVGATKKEVEIICRGKRCVTSFTNSDVHIELHHDFAHVINTRY